jgi:hypothetical protein
VFFLVFSRSDLVGLRLHGGVSGEGVALLAGSSRALWGIVARVERQAGKERHGWLLLCCWNA